jgi:hypothetical protein
VRKHFFNVAEYLIDEFYAKQGIDVTEVLEKEYSTIKDS